MSAFRCAASVMCADLGNLETVFRTAERIGVHELHFDIMDGHFVPNITLGFDFIRMARRVCSLPCEAHLMVSRPERYITRCIEAGAHSVVIHVEAVTHIHRALTHIRKQGAQVGVAVNPATPLRDLTYLLPFVDRVLVMTVEPGFAGQAFLPISLERVRILHEVIRYHKYPVAIEVDGNIHAENAARLLRLGASVFVLGTSALFLSEDTPIEEAYAAFLRNVERLQHLV
jgi:ribulose-phosphate 3-epimerase